MKEGLKLRHVDFVDNADTIAIFDARPAGLFWLLDEVRTDCFLLYAFETWSLLLTLSSSYKENAQSVKTLMLKRFLPNSTFKAHKCPLLAFQTLLDYIFHACCVCVVYVVGEQASPSQPRALHERAACACEGSRPSVHAEEVETEGAQGLARHGCVHCQALRWRRPLSHRIHTPCRPST